MKKKISQIRREDAQDGSVLAGSFANQAIEDAVLHDHSQCIEKALENAKHICSRYKVRLTPLRKTILEIIWQHHSPVKAYTIAAKLDPALASNEPPNIYRSLDFLRTQGLIHKVHTLSAYIGCVHPKLHDQCILFYCQKCKNVRELCDSASLQALQLLCAQNSFLVDTCSCEFVGTCAQCQNL